jgi:hypothetical protein
MNFGVNHLSWLAVAGFLVVYVTWVSRIPLISFQFFQGICRVGCVKMQYVELFLEITQIVQVVSYGSQAAQV